MIRTVYMVIVDRKSGRRLGQARLRKLAEAVRTDMPRGWATYRGGEYIKAGTRFLDATTREDGTCPPATPVLKVRGGDTMRDWVRALIVQHGGRIDSSSGWDREPAR